MEFSTKVIKTRKCTRQSQAVLEAPETVMYEILSVKPKPQLKLKACGDASRVECLLRKVADNSWNQLN